jgi:hypothetical protein
MFFSTTSDFYGMSGVFNGAPDSPLTKKNYGALKFLGQSEICHLTSAKLDS